MNRSLLWALAATALACAPADDPPERGPAGAAGRAPAPATDAVSETPAPEAEGGPAQPDVFTEAPERTRLGAIRSAVLESEVVFTGMEAQPHRLTLTCAFPERTRMELAGPGGAQVRYQLGRRVWSVDRTGASDGTSREMIGSDRRAVALDLALRRALFFWPDEGEFVGAGRTLSSEVGDFGVLVATLEEGGSRPSDVRAFASDGSVVGKLAVDAWFEQDGRQWPRELRLLSGDEVVWRETVRAIDADWFVGDPSFVPPDVFVAAKGSAIEGARAFELPRRTEARVPLESGLTIAAAVERARDAWSRASKGGGTGLAPFADVALDRTGAPEAVVLTAGTAAVGDAVGAADWVPEDARTAWRIPAPGRPVRERESDYRAAADRVVTAATAGGDGGARLRHRVALSRSPDGSGRPVVGEEWILGLAR